MKDAFLKDAFDIAMAGGGPAGDNSRYVVDHTASFFLVGPDGGGLMQYAHGITAEEIAEALRRFIGGQSRQEEPQ